MRDRVGLDWVMFNSMADVWMIGGHRGWCCRGGYVFICVSLRVFVLC